MKAIFYFTLGLCLIRGAALAQDAAAAFEATAVVEAGEPGAVINRNIYGQFSEHLGHCIYEGVWVGEGSPIPNTRGIRNDVVAALKKLKVPVLRWPGGCFADEYHWKDGIGPRRKRPSMINTHWGGVVENNAFGTHEFMDFCEQIGAQPYFCGNVGSGSVQEMMEWVEYVTSDAKSPMANLRRQNGHEEPWKLPFFGVGNESWGCGGNMTPEFYADNYRRYNTFVKNYPGNNIYRIACGANGADYHWTKVMMSNAVRQMNGLSLHYYCGTGRDSRSATQFSEDDWIYLLARAARMDDLITRHAQIMDRYDAQKRVGLMVDEWGTWHNVEPGTNPGFLYQQNTLRVETLRKGGRDALARPVLRLDIPNDASSRRPSASPSHARWIAAARRSRAATNVRRASITLVPCSIKRSLYVASRASSKATVPRSSAFLCVRWVV